MNILLTGPTGLIGRAVLARLLAAGHRVLAFCQNPPLDDRRPGLQWCSGDFARRTRPKHWRSELPGIDTVINTAGLWQERFPHTFDLMHREAPAALFKASADYGVKRAVHLSALGASKDAPNEYWRSKARGDEALLGHNEYAKTAIRPALVYADSARWLKLLQRLAVLPRLPIPPSSRRLQPIHLDDLADLIVFLATQHTGAMPEIIPVAGAQSLALEEWMQQLRVERGLTPAQVWHLPRALINAAAWFGESHVNGQLNRIVLEMILNAPGTTPDDQACVEALLGRPLRSII